MTIIWRIYIGKLKVFGYHQPFTFRHWKYCNVLFFKRRILNIYLQREIEDPFKRMHRANNPQKIDAQSLCSKFIKVAFYFVDLVHTLFVHARIQ